MVDTAVDEACPFHLRCARVGASARYLSRSEHSARRKCRYRSARDEEATVRLTQVLTVRSMHWYAILPAIASSRLVVPGGPEGSCPRHRWML